MSAINKTRHYKYNCKFMISVNLLAPLENGARTDQLPAKLKGGHWRSRLVIMLIKLFTMLVLYGQIELVCL